MPLPDRFDAGRNNKAEDPNEPLPMKWEPVGL